MVGLSRAETRFRAPLRNGWLCFLNVVWENLTERLPVLWDEGFGVMTPNGAVRQTGNSVVSKLNYLHGLAAWRPFWLF